MTNSAEDSLTPDPLTGMNLAELGHRFRAGRISSEAMTRAYLSRIDQLDARLGAFQHVAADSALQQARAIDALRSSGVDLGPLMGIPIAVKDLFAIDGMPVTAGSHMPLTDIIGGEGPFVKTLKRAGCVILGLTKTVEFALGASGISSTRGTPWNPWDADVHRLPGGSSSGSAVAVAAGLCALAIGTDTGGSVRVPAALCGIFGLKTTVGHWPTEGVFPLSTTLDSIGLLTRDASDAALAFSALSRPTTPAAVPPIPAPGTLRLGRLRGYMDTQIDPDVRTAFDAGVERLRTAGITIEDVDLPEAEERERLMPTILSAEIIATLGRERFETQRHAMDPVVAGRAATGLEIGAENYIRALHRRLVLEKSVTQRLQGFDGWISPTCAVPPLPVADFADPDEGAALARTVTRCSQPGNVFGLCGVNIPMASETRLPIGFQLLCTPHAEHRALAVATALTPLLGPTQAPVMTGFIGD